MNFSFYALSCLMELKESLENKEKTAFTSKFSVL